MKRGKFKDWFYVAEPSERNRRWLHRFAMVVTGWIVLLIFFGGHVKSTEAGLSVPDWPNTYGHFMFSFPWEKMVGGIFWEHTHRMIASVAGILTFILTIWVYRIDRRPWVKRLALWASIAVLAQGILGGLTVLFLLLAPISSAHGTLGQIYLCLVACLAMVTSPKWVENPSVRHESGTFPLRTLSLLTTCFIVGQLLLGAVMRHTNSGLVIPDFPTMFGSWLPPLSEEQLAAANQKLWKMGLLWSKGLKEVTVWNMLIHLAHRTFAFVVAGMVFWTYFKTRARYKNMRELIRPATLLATLILVQITLGILTIITVKQFTVTTFHVLTGALTLMTSLLLTVRVRHLLSTSPAPTVQPDAKPALVATIVHENIPA